ncbi:MAG TPA: mandelate racemase/muconate lactonizing enzyme family protein [Pirellulales bacterium]|nr:mandelate racemase/muconate lactonizing enzyme family protein [Pirellulales bacterium]
MQISTPSGTFGRRDLLASMGAAAAGGLLAANLLAQENNPAAQVADRTSTIKITGVKTYPWRGRVFVKIETNHGIAGMSELAALEPTAAVALTKSLFQLLEGENPTRIEYLWQKLYRAHRDMRGGPFMVHTISALDVCLWDITGKLWGVPVYRLLGGPCRDRIRMYPTPKAHKAPPHGIYEHSASPPDIERMKGAVEAARKMVGADGTVMFDAHCAVPPATLIQFAAAIQPYDVLFLEEVAVPGNIEVFKRLKEAIRIPLATGERDRTIWEFIPYLTERAIDIVQPDVTHSGGISQMWKIAALAEAFFVPLAPHNTNTFLGLAASLHASAAVPLFLIHEGYPDITPREWMRMPWELDADGYVALPPGPGLGVEIDEAAMEKASQEPFDWKWPVYGRLKDGSIADY